MVSEIEYRLVAIVVRIAFCVHQLRWIIHCTIARIETVSRFHKKYINVIIWHYFSCILMHLNREMTQLQFKFKATHFRLLNTWTCIDLISNSYARLFDIWMKLKLWQKWHLNFDRINLTKVLTKKLNAIFSRCIESDSVRVKRTQVELI